MIRDNIEIERYRVVVGKQASSREDGNNGVFAIGIPNNGGVIVCIASNGMSWEHVSVHVIVSLEPETLRTPTWDEMCAVKNLFWEEDECVVQYHPPKTAYINAHQNVLHLWKSIGRKIPMPPLKLV
jgi:hypothetical protein